MTLYERFADGSRRRDTMPVSCQEEWRERELILRRFVVEDLLREVAGSEDLGRGWRVCHLNVCHFVYCCMYVNRGALFWRTLEALELLMNFNIRLSLALAYCLMMFLPRDRV